MVGGWLWPGQVPVFLTQSVVPFWNRLTECNSFLQKKAFLLTYEDFFVLDFKTWFLNFKETTFQA